MDLLERLYVLNAKLVPTKGKKCWVPRHTDKDVGIWVRKAIVDAQAGNIQVPNYKEIAAAQIKQTMEFLAPDRDGFAIHTTNDVVIIDFDNVEDERKDKMIKYFNTIYQKTKRGIHFFFENDGMQRPASTGCELSDGTVYDVRGMGKAYVHYKGKLEGEDLNEISKFEKIFDCFLNKRQATITYDKPKTFTLDFAEAHKLWVCDKTFADWYLDPPQIDRNKVLSLMVEVAKQRGYLETNEQKDMLRSYIHDVAGATGYDDKSIQKKINQI